MKHTSFISVLLHVRSLFCSLGCHCLPEARPVQEFLAPPGEAAVGLEDGKVVSKSWNELSETWSHVDPDTDLPHVYFLPYMFDIYI